MWFLADRTTTEYDRLAIGYRHPVKVVPCSVFPAGKFLFDPSDTFAVMYGLATQRAEKKRIEDGQSGRSLVVLCSVIR